jgi:hypothetical protein
MLRAIMKYIPTFRQGIIFLLAGFLGVGQLSAYVPTLLQPMRWHGKKWEYLVEHPSQNVVNPVLFEELLDSAGAHGWQLVEISGTNHFYVFYFKRPLLAHKIEPHLYRLSRQKLARGKEEAALRHQIHETVVVPREVLAQEKARTSSSALPPLPAKP